MAKPKTSGLLLTIERAALLRSLGHVKGAVESKVTIPVLRNVLLRARGDVLSLSATDMDLEISERVAAEIATPGEVTVDANLLHEIVRKLPDGAQIELDCDESLTQMKLRSGRSNFKLGCLSADDFPTMAGSNLEHSFEISASDLRGMLDRTRFAISTEDTRFYLCGIHIHAGETWVDRNPVLKAVATDGCRMARVEIPLPQGATNIPGIIIPRKTISEVRKLIDEVAGLITIQVSETKIQVAFGDTAITSKLIDGTFPDYERVIPVGNDKVMLVKAAELAKAVDRVATVSTERSRAVKLNLSRGLLTLSVSTNDTGSAEESLEVKYDGPPLEIGFNAKYLLDACQQISGDEVKFIMMDAATPAIVLDMDDESLLAVLMPMRV